MKALCKYDPKFVFLITFFFNSLIQSQQLALPIQTIATVGTHKISVNDFVTRYNDYISSAGIKDNIVTRRSILNNMISEILLYYYDDNQKIFNDPEYQKELKWADKQTILAYLKDQEIYGKVKVTDQEIRDAYYKSNERIAARHLYAATEEETDNLYQLLQSGSDFQTLAKQVFSDTTLQNNGGYLGYFSWGDMDPAFEDAAYALKVGEISKPVKTKSGYSIIKLEDRKSHPLLTETEFLKKRKQMERVVRMRKMRPTEIGYLNKIFNPNKVWIDEKLLGNILNNLLYSQKSSIEKNKMQYSDAVCVKYKSKNYTRNEFEKRIDEVPLFHREKITSIDNLKTFAEGIVAQDILLDIASKKGYYKNDEVKNVQSKYRNNIFLRYKRKEVALNNTQFDSSIYKFYTDNIQYFKTEDQMNVQEIILNRKALADSLLSQIKNGNDFGTLAKEYSLRNWSAKNKGEIEFAEVSKYGMLKDTLWKSDIGKVIGPISIESYFGIFKVLGKKTAELQKFEAVKEKATQLLKKEKSKEIMQKYIEKLMAKVPVKVDEKILVSAEL